MAWIFHRTGKPVITINSGAAPFSVTLIHDVGSSPVTSLVNLDATFLGVQFSHDGSRFFASGGEDGVIWVGDSTSGAIVGLVNLNGSSHALTGPVDPAVTPNGKVEGTFPGDMTLSRDGRFLYVVDQGAFQADVIDTSKIDLVNHGIGALDPNNFGAVSRRLSTGRYPFGIALSPNGRKLFVSNVGIFQYKHLTPQHPTGDRNEDYPLGYPALAYPDQLSTRSIEIKKVDPSHLPNTLSIPDGIQVGYINHDIEYTVPGLGSPNVPEASSVYAYSLGREEDREEEEDGDGRPSNKSVKIRPLVGEEERGIVTFGGSHPNALVASSRFIYVSVGNNDSISVLRRGSLEEVKRINLQVLEGFDGRLKGVQPVALALSQDEDRLYVAEAGINAIAVIRLSEDDAKVEGHIPVGWWPSAIRLSRDGRTLCVANARGRGAPANPGFPPGSPKYATLGTVNVIPVPTKSRLDSYTDRVLINNGFVPGERPAEGNPIPNEANRPSSKIKHIIFINKENSTYDQLLGDITSTRKGVPVEGDPAFSLGRAASPNHHELALQFAFSDNFFLEPTVSSDGHRWLTDTYPTEFEDTHWPASYGGRRNDAGDDPAVYKPYPGRLGFTDANGSAAPEDYDQHGSIYLHLARNGKSFVNFGNGFEFAEVDEDPGTEPTGIRNHVNVPMEKVLRDHSDHLYPEFNTHIPDAPLKDQPARFSRFGRFKQVFESHYEDKSKDTCTLPAYVDLYYPNDHGGGPNDINPNGPAWSYTRFVQDNDTALGLTVDLISHSPCWKDTVIFVVEDDSQNGLDHVNGFRSIFLAISPWVKREYVGKTHYSLSSIFKTVNLILGIPPLNQYDAVATDLRDIFTAKPNFAPYNEQPELYARGANKAWISMTKGLKFATPDSDEVKLRAAILKSEGLPRTN